MANYAFIFARGGSKGLPKKNIKLLDGIPLINYSIKTALVCAMCDKVFVSTDDKDIADIAEQVGAEIIPRPKHLAQDNSPEWSAWQHAIAYVKNKYGEFDNFVSLPATSPLRAVTDVEAAIEKLQQNNADICISVTPASRSPFFNMVRFDGDYCQLVNQLPLEVTRRQDAPVVFDITTVVYVAKANYIEQQNKLFDGKVTAIEVPKERAVDIDDIYDFYFAESLLKMNTTS